MNFIVGVLVNLLPPLIGLVGFFLLCLSMQRAHAQSPPFLSFFILFVTYGGWLMVILTSLFWVGSGMASLGVFYLVFVAPFVTVFLGWRLRKDRRISAFHRAAFVASIGYTSVIGGVVMVWWALRFL